MRATRSGSPSSTAAISCGELGVAGGLVGGAIGSNGVAHATSLRSALASNIVGLSAADVGAGAETIAAFGPLRRRYNSQAPASLSCEASMVQVASGRGSCMGQAVGQTVIERRAPFYRPPMSGSQPSHYSSSCFAASSCSPHDPLSAGRPGRRARSGRSTSAPFRAGAPGSPGPPGAPVGRPDRRRRHDRAARARPGSSACSRGSTTRSARSGSCGAWPSERLLRPARTRPALFGRAHQRPEHRGADRGGRLVRHGAGQSQGLHAARPGGPRGPLGGPWRPVPGSTTAANGSASPPIARSTACSSTCRPRSRPGFVTGSSMCSPRWGPTASARWAASMTTSTGPSASRRRITLALEVLGRPPGGPPCLVASHDPVPAQRRRRLCLQLPGHADGRRRLLRGAEGIRAVGARPGRLRRLRRRQGQALGAALRVLSAGCAAGRPCPSPTRAGRTATTCMSTRSRACPSCRS